MTEPAASPAGPARGAVKSADRALALVEFVAERRSVTFADVLEGLDLPRSSAHGLLATLESSGWLHRHEQTKRYSLGLRAWQVGQAYGAHRELAEIAKPIMDRLCATTGETVQLAVLDGIENVYIAISESPSPMRLASSVGMRLHAHATGIGKALLSEVPPAEVAARLDAVELPRLTERTIVEVPRLLEVVARVRDRGYALDDEEFIDGCRCVAVPISSAETLGLVSAMSVTMPTLRTDAHWPAGVLPPLQAAAAEIRGALGLTR